MTTGGNRLVSRGTGIPRPRHSAVHTSDGSGPPRVRPTGWWFDAVMLAIFAVITVGLVLNNRWLLDLDLAALHWSDNHRNALSWWSAYALSCLGQGGPLTYGTLLISLFLGWRRRSIRPVLIPVAAFLLTYLGIGPVKVWSNRAVPHHGPVEMFAHPDGPFSMAYPSGHTGNAIVWYGALMLLIGPYLPRFLYWLVRIGAPMTVALTMVYIDYHWLTDVAAAIPLGLVLSRILYRIPFDTMRLPRFGRSVELAERTEQPERPSAKPALLPASWTRLPQLAARPARRVGPLSRLWFGSRPGVAERHDSPRRRRPASSGPAGRQLRFTHGRGGSASVRFRDEFE